MHARYSFDNFTLAVKVSVKQDVKLCHGEVSSEQDTNFLSQRGCVKRSLFQSNLDFQDRETLLALSQDEVKLPKCLVENNSMAKICCNNTGGGCLLPILGTMSVL